MPDEHNKIILIKIAHTAIWLVMATGVIYILYCGITGGTGIFLYLAIGLLLFEICVLLICGWSCPLTIVAKKIKTDWRDGDDIYLPIWLAKNNKMIFGTLLAVGLTLLALRVFFS